MTKSCSVKINVTSSFSYRITEQTLQVRFIIFKRTGLAPWFQRSKQWFKPIFWAPDIDRNMLRFNGLVWILRFKHYSVNISGLENWITFLFAALKPWLQAGSFAHHKPLIIWILIVDQNNNLIISIFWFPPGKHTQDNFYHEKIQISLHPCQAFFLVLCICLYSVCILLSVWSRFSE
jgi:hypothetical protein